jgi:hypothetical protein
VKKLGTDRIGVVTAGIGIVLMILTVEWQVNPVEGSVMPDFLTSNPFGLTLLYVLLVTCMPVWIPVVFAVVVLTGLPESDGVALGNGAAIIVQGIVYLMLGKLISIGASSFRVGRNPKQ